MTNDLKHAFGDKPNSEFVISPEGKVLIARNWSDPEQLRKDLEKLVGKADTHTQPSDLDRPARDGETRDSKVARGIIPRVERPSGSEPLRVTTHPKENREPLYLKLRAEASLTLRREGKGSLFLGFHLDPIHSVHWNNLAPPLRFKISAPDGTTVNPASGEAAKITEAEADGDPREFLVDVDRGSSDKPIEIAVSYFACDDGDEWCKAATQRFTLTWQADRDGGRVQSSRRGGSRKPGMKGRPGSGMPEPSRILSRFDKNGDGTISREEATGPMARRFDQLDADGNNEVTKEELTTSFEARRRR